MRDKSEGKPRKRIEPGQKMGYLRCIHQAEQSGFGGAVWLCRCGCGREIEVSEAMLISGVIRSCGCKPGKAANLQGSRFGKLTALRPVPKRAADGSICWLCRCDCGNYALVSSNKLNTGHNASCGCVQNIPAQEAKTYIDGTCVEIMLSKTIAKNNTSGYRDVARKRDKWQAYINYGGQRRNLGTFETKEEAAEARRRADELVRERLNRLMDGEKAKDD